MKRLLNKYGQPLLTLALGLWVFLFWRLQYPHALAYQEQFQLFLFDDDYLMDRLAVPGGLARYIGEFLTQFYNSITIGALIIAMLMMLVQHLTWRLLRNHFSLFTFHFSLSFLPVAILWYAMGDESVLLGYHVALILAMAFALGMRRLCEGNRVAAIVTMLIGVPLLYWLIGPMAVLTVLFFSPWWMALAGVLYGVACLLVSAHFLPFPLKVLACGIGFYRSPASLSYAMMLLPIVIVLLAKCVRFLPQSASKFPTAAAAMVMICLLYLAQTIGFDTKKYDLIEYDYLVRISNWQGIIEKSTRQQPDLPMSVSATNLALAMTNQLGEHAFDFYQRGSEGLLPHFERNFATAQLTGEIYYRLGLVNTAQRYAFESMEALPNYNKSGRVVKRLAETNLINGNYAVARKYLQMLEKTVFYRPWAQRTLAMLGNEQAINAHPFYGTLRKYKLEEDFLFSDNELDKICGQLFMHCTDNRMATQYLLMIPLMDRDMERFMHYVMIVQNRTQYNPRVVQEGIAIAFMQQRQPLPKGVVSPFVQQQLKNSNTWYYLTGKK